jgi:hypothetical protein
LPGRFGVLDPPDAAAFAVVRDVQGLDLAREHGQVDWDVEACEWFVPEEK